MDGIRPKLFALPNATPAVSFAPPTAPVDQLGPSTFQGEADRLRSLAKTRLQSVEPNPGPGLIELTALQLAEQQYLQSGAPPLQPNVPLQGMLRSTTYLNALASAQLGVPPALAPALMEVLSELDPSKIFGAPQHNGANAWIVAGGNLDTQIKASQAAGSQANVLGFPITGVTDPRDVQHIKDALQPLIEAMGPQRLHTLVQRIHVQTLLGEMQLSDKNWSMTGLGGQGSIGLSRESLLDPNKSRDNLAHEVGHLVDQQVGGQRGLATLSGAPDSPFGRGQLASDFRSQYATLNASEDFAEAHADLIKNWSTYQKHPQLTMLAQGTYGEKLAYIAREAYGWELPPANPAYTQMRAEVLEGKSPFGYLDGQQRLIGAAPAFQQAVRALIEHVGSDGKLKPSFLESSPAVELAGRQWLQSQLYDEQAKVGQPISVAGLVADLRQVASLPPDSPQRAVSDSQLLSSLKQGGSAFFQSSFEYIQSHYPANQAAQLLASLNPYLAAAAPHWIAGS